MSHAARAAAVAFAFSVSALTALSTTQQQTPATAPATDVGWPRDMASGDLAFTIYQPQLDTWDGYRIGFHAAVAAGRKGEAPTYGVIWLSARASVDKPLRLVTLDEIAIPRVSFPASADAGAAYKTALATLLPKKSRVIALDRIEADMAILAAETKAESLPVRNDPPMIVFSKRPAILLFVDGAPVFRDVEGSTLRRLVNTRPLVLADAFGGVYLHLFDGWLLAPSLDGPWQVATNPPASLDAALKKLAPLNVVDLLEGSPSDAKDPKTLPSLAKGPVPTVVHASLPTELIVTEGEPAFVPIDGTQLLYVSNTTGNVFKYNVDQQTYVLVAGRWFRAPSSMGPWQFVAGHDLPKDFAAIPDTSPKENVKASIPGTRQAQEALISNGIPQTAQVDRTKTKMTEPAYDGAPQLKPIEGTPLLYVANTATPVIKVDDRDWFAVDKGVWFVGSSPAGPWTVAADVPTVIYTIPPSSPLHYVTYVKVYNSTPQVVYVGYTPGYTGTVVGTDNVVVYGTGYVYTPWVGAYYYPPPPTYGYAVAIRYTPWTGWSMGVGFGWSYGATTVVAVGCYPSWGAYYYPPYYKPPYYGAVATPYGAAVWGSAGWAQTTGNVYSSYGSTSMVTRTSSGYNAYTGNSWASQSGQSYNSATGQLSGGQRAAVGNAYTGNYVAGRQGYTTNAYTGASAAGRQTVSGNAYTGQYTANSQGAGYNPQTGNYAAGQKTTSGNTQTGQSVTAASGTVGNTKTGQSTDYKGVSGSGGAGAAQVGNTTVAKSQSGDMYASKDGNVYSKDSSGGWNQYQPSSGSSSKSASSGSGSWNSVPKSSSTSQLDSSANARASGEQKSSNYQSSGGGWGGGGRSGSSGGGGRSGGGRR